jgi:hypothetical protein
VSTHQKGRICFLKGWELEESKRGIKPNCRNHRHISNAEAFELSGRPSFGTILAPVSETGTAEPFGYFVKIAGRIEFTITNPKSEPPFDQVRAKGLELEKKLGIPFIDRKVPSRFRL